MAVFVAQVKGATAMGKTDLNKVSETILIPLFSEIYGYNNLKNLNDTEKANYPGIDLGDEIARVAFQITSTSNSEKIKKTLRQFVEYELYKRYDKLIIYILGEKQQSYSGSGYEEIIKGKFTFNQDKDIWDYRDILKEVSSFQIDKARRVENILEANFGSSDGANFGNFYLTPTEIVSLNLLEVSFPPELYVSELAINRIDVINASESQEYKIKLNQKSSTRDVVKAAIEQKGLQLGWDWVFYEGKIITFHDLNDKTLPLATIIEQKTTKTVSSKKFSEIDSNRERVFKSLLGRCLQQKLRYEQVYWQHEEQLFIFSAVEKEEKRVEQWYGKKESERTVYERVMKKDKPKEIYYCKHLGFRTQYKCFGEQWYVVIKPEWFFSFDGYKRSFYGVERIKWLKRNENNKNVSNHLRFIAYFLKNDKQSDLFVTRTIYPFLSFGELVSFDSALDLDDKEWLPEKSKEDECNMEYSQQISLFET